MTSGAMRGLGIVLPVEASMVGAARGGRATNAQMKRHSEHRDFAASLDTNKIITLAHRDPAMEWTPERSSAT
jgi:hypothetical protein